MAPIKSGVKINKPPNPVSVSGDESETLEDEKEGVALRGEELSSDTSVAAGSASCRGFSQPFGRRSVALSEACGVSGSGLAGASCTGPSVGASAEG